jgi:hypothetical protein
MPQVINASAIAETLEYMLTSPEDSQALVDEAGLGELESVMSYEEAGLLTTDKGFVIRLHSGEEFQVRVIQSKYAN